MKVIAFSLSLFHPTAKGLKDPSTEDAFHQLSFRNFGFGEEHAAPNFLEGTWKGCLVLMEYSWPKRIRIASLRLDKFVYLRRSLNSRALARENKLPKPPLAVVSLIYAPMSTTQSWLTFLVVSAGLCGLMFCMDFLLGTHMILTVLNMVQGLLKKVYVETASTVFQRGLLV